MNIPLRIQRWRALYRVPVLGAESPDGSLVQATGHARRRPGDELFVPPVASEPCVIAWNHYGLKPTIERLRLRPFLLETEQDVLVVDASHVELLLPIARGGNTDEICVREGEHVTIVGTLLRDDSAPSDGEAPFRELPLGERVGGCKLVGSKAHPIVITSA